MLMILIQSWNASEISPKWEKGGKISWKSLSYHIYYSF